MKTFLFVALMVLSIVVDSARAATSAFTYQGRLMDGGQPANGAYDIQFTLFTASGGGANLGTVTWSPASVTNGVFTVTLDFGAAAFNGGDRWLELAVRPSASGQPFAVLIPRQPIAATPYAVRAANFDGPVADAQLPGNIARLDQSGTFGGTVGFGGAVTTGLAPVVIQGRGQNSDWLRLTGSNGENRWHLTGAAGGLNFAETGVADHRLFLQPGGNVGIGISNPSQRLHVQGNALVSGSVTVGGALRSLGSTHLFIPGVACVKMYPADTTQFSADAVGGVRVFRGNLAGAKVLQFPVTVPAVLHGQSATIQSVTIYYACQNGANNFISQTALTKRGDGGVATILDSTPRTSNVDTSYTLAANSLGALSSEQGLLGLIVTLSFANATDWIQISGARITLAYQ